MNLEKKEKHSGSRRIEQQPFPDRRTLKFPHCADVFFPIINSGKRPDRICHTHVDHTHQASCRFMDTEGHDIHARSRSGQYPVGKNSSHRARSTGQPGRQAVFKNSFQNPRHVPCLRDLKPQDSFLLPEMGAHDSEIGKLGNRRGKPQQEHSAA